MAVAEADVVDLSELTALCDLLYRSARRDRLLEEGNDELHAVFVHGAFDALAILVGQCKHLFGENMLFCLRDPYHVVGMVTGRRADDHAFRVAFEELVERCEYGNVEFCEKFRAKCVVLLVNADDLTERCGVLCVILGVDVPRSTYRDLHQK